MNYQEICDQVRKVALETGSFIREEHLHFNLKKVEVKGHADFVSYVDKTSERKIVAQLEKILPEAGFIAEEGTCDKKGDRYNWIIDPLDGTTNFIHGIPTFAISIALNDGEETVLGVVYEINRDECFYAWKGSKAYLNGNEIKVSEASTTQESLIGIGFPYSDFDLMPKYMESVNVLMKQSHGLRRIGSAATDLVYVAAGRFDAFFEYSLHPWDVAAGALILQQAGGRVCDFQGGGNYIFGEEIIATNKNYYQEFFSIVNKYLSRQ